MNGKVTIRKAANALLVLFISASHVTTATEIYEQLSVDLHPKTGTLRELGNGKEKHISSKQFRNHDYYRQELQKLEESTRLIHEEVDRILAEFRKNMEEYRKHTRGTGTIPALDQQQKVREEAEQKVADEKAAAEEIVWVKAEEEEEEEEEVQKCEEQEKAEKLLLEKQRERPQKKARKKAKEEAKEHEEQRKVEEAQRLAKENAPSELVRGYSYYQRELEKLAESTRRIHEEVDRILAEFRKNMEDYYRHVRSVWMKTTPTPTTPEIVGKEEAGQEEKETVQNQAEGKITGKPAYNTSQEKSTLNAPQARPQPLKTVNVRSGDTPIPQIRSKDPSEKAKEITNVLIQLAFWNLTEGQQDELDDLILAKLDEFKGPEFLVNDKRNKLISKLNTASSFKEARAILENDAKSPTVLLKTDFLTDEGMKKRDADIQTGKLATIGHMYQDQINKDTAQVLEESGIQGWITKLSEPDRKAIESDIERIVTKLYDKSSSNLTGGANPLQPFIKAFKKVKTLKDFKGKLAKFEEEGEEFKKVVEKVKKSEKLTVDMDAIASTLPMEFRPMISKQNSFLINNIDAFEVSSLLKFKDGKNLTKAAEFEKLKTSMGTGFVVVPVGSETPNQQMNMKFFSLGIEEKFSLTLPKKGESKLKKHITNPQPFQEVKYYKVISTSSAQELQTLKDKLSDGKYELWSLPGDDRGRHFFAISADYTQPVISFSLNQGDPRLQGTVYNHIDMVKFLMSGQEGPFQGGTVGAIKEINSKK